MKIVSINSKDTKRSLRKINEDAVKVLENALERVKAGELTAVGIAWVTKDRGIGGDISEGRNTIMMWAALQHTTASFYEDCIN